MSVSYKAALKLKRQEVLTEIERLRDQAAHVSSALSLRENQLRNIDDLLAVENGHARSAATDAVPSENRVPSLADRAFEVLQEVGKPLHYRDLVQRLQETNVHVPGKDPGANLISHLSRDQRFGRAGRGTYGLSEWPSVRTAIRSRRRRRLSKRKVRASA